MVHESLCQISIRYALDYEFLISNPNHKYTECVVSSADYLEVIPVNGYLSEMEKLWSSLRLHYKELLIVAPSWRGHSVMT